MAEEKYYRIPLSQEPNGIVRGKLPGTLATDLGLEPGSAVVIKADGKKLVGISILTPEKHEALKEREAKAKAKAKPAPATAKPVAKKAAPPKKASVPAGKKVLPATTTKAVSKKGRKTEVNYEAPPEKPVAKTKGKPTAKVAKKPAEKRFSLKKGLKKIPRS